MPETVSSEPHDGSPPRLLLACVAENRADFRSKVENLLLSRAAFGGQLRDAPFVVCVVDRVDAATRRAYEDLGATVRTVPPLGLDGHGLANKLRMFDLAEDDPFDVLLGLDCDTVIVGDASQELGSVAGVNVAPADHNPLTPSEWLRL